MVLIMTVEPWSGGQNFMAEMMPKLSKPGERPKRLNQDIWLQAEWWNQRRDYFNGWREQMPLLLVALYIEQSHQR
jgi:hypothetical protein